ncbi:hypothetical protein [Bifidobacterium sp. UTBIF-68]|uniref:hypothetical protein n=1 Tax=Bifidobacterium sp. UTBIF-68 TaxID=1465262 RepID=UPI0011276141|nr:hypothetical protein [Bifidobacterium sp. UTBIF-68]
MKDSTEPGFAPVLRSRGLTGLSFRRLDWLRGVAAACHEPSPAQLAVAGLMYEDLVSGLGGLPLRERAGLAWMAYRDVASSASIVTPYTVGSRVAFNAGAAWVLSVGLTSNELHDVNLVEGIILADAMTDEGRSFAAEVVRLVASSRRVAAAGLLSDLVI